MANQRGKNIKRISLTLPDELLARVEQEVQKTGRDRLAVIRDAIRDYLDVKAPLPKSRSSGAKEKKQ
jgi:metal-responsive CopG/Arc/MetJ family transcriptional regulator